MNYRNFFRWLEKAYKIDINKELQNVLEEHFGDDLGIYTDQDLYEQSRKIIQNSQMKNLQNKYKKYKFEE